MERWIIFASMAAMVIALALAGAHYHRRAPNSSLCTNADAHCLERPYFGP
jgi:hypothetical protein